MKLELEEVEIMPESIPTLDLPETENPGICAACRLERAESGYSTLLCVTCRDRLARRPFPLSIKLCTLLIVIALIFAGKRFDRSIRAGISFTRGRWAEKKHDSARAMQHYQEVVAIFPNSTPALIRLAKAQCEVGQIDEAATILGQLAGQVIPRELVSDYERTVRQITYELRLREAGHTDVRTR